MRDYVLEDYKNSNSYRVKFVSGMNAAESVRGDYHRSMNLIFILFKKGRGHINIEGSAYEFNEGDVIMLNPSEFFLCNIDNKTFHERITLLVNLRLATPFPSDCLVLFSSFYNREKKMGNILPADVVEKNGIDALFYDLLEIERRNSQTKETLGMCKMIEIMCRINEELGDRTDASDRKTVVGPFVDRILGYVEENYTSDITIQSVADHFGFHRSYLSHEFNKQMGTSLWNYIILRRIYKFNSLMTSSSSIEEVAYSVGFHNYSNFFRLYKKHMGITPMEYKRQCNKK